MSEQRVLVVDDEEALADMVGAYLTRAGFEVALAHTGPAGLEQARSWEPDVIVLDLGLPGLDGVEVCRQVRTFSSAYVVMLTARDDEVDKIVGLSVGADDYVTKPFSPRELVARVQAMLRRPREADPVAHVRRFGGLRVDVTGHEVSIDDTPVELTPTEFDLLLVLSESPHRAFTRAQLTEAVWGGTWHGDGHLVDVHIANLRKKLGDDPERGRYVSTVRGVGYRMGRG
ncbi:response regulator transcription factor [Ammonicoccus fulvus]|uniref:Response regulator transcription factor n=1 Tax=Ammonicoccus fulvus TaxID=3138240 RepID=A0ABZ3FRE7_9ACTN